MSDDDYGSEEYEEYSDDDDGGVFGEEEASTDFKKLLEADIELLREDGYNAGWSHHALELFVWVAIPPTFVSEEFAGACGISLDRNIVCKITFDTPPSYMSACPSVEGKSIMIRQSNDTDLNKSKLLDLQFFGLWWTLEQRLSAHLKKNWASLQGKAKEALATLGEGGGDEVQQVIETTGVSKELAAFALSKCHKDVQQAIGMLLDESDQARLEKEMAKGKETEKEAEDEDEEEKPSRESLLSEIVKFIKEAIKHSTASCIVCNKPHPLELLKPTVCDDALCNFQFVELGLGINLESDIMHLPESVDLLISLTVAATSGRHFNPFPTPVRVEKMIDGKLTTLEFKPENPAEIGQVLNKLPAISELQQLVLKGKLKETLDETHPLLYKLVRWILGTNRAHLQKLRSNEKIKEFTTDLQFMMKSSPPATEKKFQMLKKQEGGSFYAFHGSPFSNWHSILRNGLKNYSNTANMTTGAVYGPGIYMAVDSGTSLGYTGYSSASWVNSMFGQSLKCMALCEVIDHGESDPAKCKGGLHRPNCCHCTGAPFYRCEEEAYVCTRFLMLFKDGDSPNLQASAITVPNSLRRSFKGMKASKGGL